MSVTIIQDIKHKKKKKRFRIPKWYLKAGLDLRKCGWYT